MKRVVVGLSGGVDSSVAAHLLVKEGYEVIGMFMRNWHDESVTLSDECPWIEDSNDALLVAQQLGIPFQVIDLSEAYKSRIVDYMFDEYQRGRTPNPDILCNREIKFDVFLEAAMKLGADFVATGHYCRKSDNKDGSYSLLAGIDKTKDQSYFLCQITQNQLSKALFPIGHLEKQEVRKIAMELNLVTAEKKDSQGLCFVGKISLPLFLQQQLKAKTGEIIEIPQELPQYELYNNLNATAKNISELAAPFIYTKDMGTVVGQHQGAYYYTIGQRKGLQIGGKPLPSFIIGVDTINNLIYTGQSELHNGLNKYALKIEINSINWLNNNILFNKNNILSCRVRIRYRQPLQDAILLRVNGDVFVLFSKKQKGVTPGQFAAWYQGDELVGSGVIEH
jgi:tRNA-specific 2-thiouridylase